MTLLLRSAARPKIGTAKRDFVPVTSRDIPGPDTYNVRDSNITLKYEPRTVFGSGTRPPLS
jgi:hypothetical protein